MSRVERSAGANGLHQEFLPISDNGVNTSTMGHKPHKAEAGAGLLPGRSGQRVGLTTAGIRVLRVGLSHLLWERGASGVEAHLRVLWGLRATGRALRGVQVKGRVALTAAAAGRACQRPVGGRTEPQPLKQRGALPRSPLPDLVSFPQYRGGNSLACYGKIAFLT